MGRVWILAGAIIVGCFIVYLLVGFVGTEALKFVGVGVGNGAIAAYLPGKVGMSRGFYLMLGPTLGAAGFLIGATAAPDTPLGLFMGGSIPILISALVAMGTKSAETLLVLLAGAGTLGAIYTTAFHSDPQSINYTLPIAIGQSMILLAIGYIGAMAAKTFGPQPAEEKAAGPDEDDEDMSATTAIPTVDSTEVAR